MSGAPKRLYLSQTDKKLGGVCGGIAAFLAMDSTIVRVLWVLLTIVSVGLGILAYLVIWLMVPREPMTSALPAPPQTTRN